MKALTGSCVTLSRPQCWPVCRETSPGNLCIQSADRLERICYVITYAADAWYHGLLAPEYQTDRPYIPMALEINDAWTFPTDSWGGYLSQEQTINECISKNPFLKVWVLCGYFDGATPFYSAEYTFSHLFLNEDQKDSLSFTYYPCGHMVYMEKASYDKFRQDAEEWYLK